MVYEPRQHYEDSKIKSRRTFMRRRKEDYKMNNYTRVVKLKGDKTNYTASTYFHI